MRKTAYSLSVTSLTFPSFSLNIGVVECNEPHMITVISSDRFFLVRPLIVRFMGPTWGPSGADRTQVGPMLAPWTLPSGACLTFKTADLCWYQTKIRNRIPSWGSFPCIISDRVIKVSTNDKRRYVRNIFSHSLDLASIIVVNRCDWSVIILP